MALYSIYIHIPFCSHRCAYCDFNTYAGLEFLVPLYVNALCKEVIFFAKSAPEKISLLSIYFGGGTPSLLPTKELEKILVCLQDNFLFLKNIEITLEANPSKLNYEYLRDIYSLGINRLSLGVQSLNSEELQLLERNHTYLDVVYAGKNARKAGFTNVNFDLIFGLPNQRIETWKKNLSQVLMLHPEHVSLYALTLEHGTPMHNWINRGLMSESDNDLAADMYELSYEILSHFGYEQYEISNWALQQNNETMGCRHNLQYWHNLPYIGVGAGAHGYLGGMRLSNVLSPKQYIRRLEMIGNNLDKTKHRERYPKTPATVHTSVITHEIEMTETMLMGLRLTKEGVSKSRFEKRFGIQVENIFEKEINQLVLDGLLERVGDLIRLTTRGKLLGNQVFRYFV